MADEAWMDEVDEQYFCGWLVQLAVGPTSDKVNPKQRFFELADLVVSRMELEKGETVVMTEMERIRDRYRDAGHVECAAGMDVLVGRGYAEIEYVAGREAPRN